jgi:2-dehydro-3-deoxyphosphogluconate aldolase/(4S)-4-hydroxy-2-oxoglutarate aldolase
LTVGGEIVDALLEQRVLAIVRLSRGSDAVAACRILADAGFRALEISLAMPKALEALEAATRELEGVAFVGAGTVRNVEHAEQAIAAGASFLVAPSLNAEVGSCAERHGLLYVPGALTPGEVEEAAASAPLVKLFPASCFGPRYIADLLAPFPELALVPTGGVDLENANAYLAAGAAAVAIGNGLVNDRSIRDLDELTETARRALRLTSAPTTTTRRA